jgi:DNA-binding CsgD family transcriptional regulator
MPARKFTDEQEQEICRRYLAGESTYRLGKALGADPVTICNALLRNGVTMRSLAESRRELTDEQQQEICRRYLLGESSGKIGNALGVHPSSVLNTLKRFKIKSRECTPPRMFTETQEQEICRRYLEGEDSPSLGKAFGCSGGTILKIIARHGIKARNSSKCRALTADVQAEICTRYVAGERTAVLALEYGRDPKSILQVLRRHGVKRRTKGPSFKLTAEQIAEARIRYEAQELTKEIAQSYGVSDVCLLTYLRNAGVRIRTTGETQQGRPMGARVDITGQRFGRLTALRFLPNSRSAWVCRCDCGNTHTANISALKTGKVKSCGCYRRDVAAVDDVEGLLSGKLRQIDQHAEFYVYELANHAGYCKPGVDATGRRATSTEAAGEYGEQGLSIPGIRRDVWLLEQAVLHETRAHRDCPEDLATRRWRGWTEVRKMPADDLCTIAINLHEQLLELGCWEFAARYVPMTAAQRLQCQQRALQEVAA